MNKVSDFFIKMNPVIHPILDSCFHRLFSSRLVLLKFTGRKSGKEFVTPVGYSKFGDTILIGLTETHNRNWWRNYREPWPMMLKHKGRWLEGEGLVVVPGSEEYVAWCDKIFTRDAFMPKIFKIHDYNPDEGLQDGQLQILLENGSGLVKFTRQA